MKCYYSGLDDDDATDTVMPLSFPQGSCSPTSPLVRPTALAADSPFRAILILTGRLWLELIDMITFGQITEVLIFSSVPPVTMTLYSIRSDKERSARSMYDTVV